VTLRRAFIDPNNTLVWHAPRGFASLSISLDDFAEEDDGRPAGFDDVTPMYRRYFYRAGAAAPALNIFLMVAMAVYRRFIYGDIDS